MFCADSHVTNFRVINIDAQSGLDINKCCNHSHPILCIRLRLQCQAPLRKSINQGLSHCPHLLISAMGIALHLRSLMKRRGESARKSSKVSKMVCILFIYDMFFSYPITICLATGVQDLGLGCKGAIAEAIPAGALTRQVFQNSREGTGVLREGVAAG